jgi:hypothetical protein
MMAKMLRTNGQVIHTSTYRLLTPDELAKSDEIKSREHFDKSIGEKLGPGTAPGDIKDDEFETSKCLNATRTTLVKR